MPHYVLSKVVDALNARRKALRGSKILVLGVSYKRDTNDTRESPALDLMRLLRERGAVVSYHDPHVPDLPSGSHGPSLKSVSLNGRTLRGFDCAVIVTDHSSVDYQRIVDGVPVIVDSRNATRGVRRGRSKLVKL